MSKIGYPLKLPRSVKAAAAGLAHANGVSLNQWIATAVAEKIGAVEATEHYLRQRAGEAKPDDLLRFLRAAPEREPAAEDRIG